MLEAKAALVERDLAKEPLTAAELDRLIGDRSHLDFLNPKNELYRTLKMKEKPPARQQAIQLMAKNPNLIRRPVVVRGKQRVLGFDAEKLRTLVE